MKSGFFKYTNIKGLTITTDILEDDRLSIGAKGLYVQIVFCNNNLTSLNDITSYTTSTKDEIDEWFKELVDNGYIDVGKKETELLKKPKGAKAIAKSATPTAVATAMNAVTPQTPTANKYDKMVALVNSYELSDNVKQALITYFEKWMSGKGRYANTEIHATRVRSIITELISFHCTDEEMISIIQTSIDREWYKFFKPETKQTTPTFNAFNKDTLVSGNYTQEEMEALKQRRTY